MYQKTEETSKYRQRLSKTTLPQIIYWLTSNFEFINNTHFEVTSQTAVYIKASKAWNPTYSIGPVSEYKSAQPRGVAKSFNFDCKGKRKKFAYQTKIS